MEFRHTVHEIYFFWIRVLLPDNLTLLRFIIKQSALIIPITCQSINNVFVIIFFLNKSLAFKSKCFSCKPTALLKSYLTSFLRSSCVSNSHSITYIDVKLAYDQIISTQLRHNNLICFVKLIKININSEHIFNLYCSTIKTSLSV